MAKKKKKEEEDILVDSKLMIFSGSNFMLKQSKSGYSNFDLYREKIINKGKDNERVDLVLIGHGLSFQTAIQMYILDKLRDRDYTLKEYLKEYDNSYPILDELALKGEEFLKNKGYKAYALTKERVSVPDNKTTLIPFKTVATRSGLGWIGKSALFITPKYGSAVRLITILTNAPLDFNKPITASLCGMCRICQDNCPADAITGLTWNPKLERNDLFEYKKCLNVFEELAENEFHNPNVKVCSKCISVCPNTQRYVEK